MERWHFYSCDSSASASSPCNTKDSQMEILSRYFPVCCSNQVKLMVDDDLMDVTRLRPEWSSRETIRFPLLVSSAARPNNPRPRGRERLPTSFRGLCASSQPVAAACRASFSSPSLLSIKELPRSTGPSETRAGSSITARTPPMGMDGARALLAVLAAAAVD